MNFEGLDGIINSLFKIPEAIWNLMKTILKMIIKGWNSLPLGVHIFVYVIAGAFFVYLVIWSYRNIDEWKRRII